MQSFQISSLDDSSELGSFVSNPDWPDHRRDSVLHSPTPSFKASNRDDNEALIYNARIGNAAAVADLLGAKYRKEINLNVNHLGAMKWDRGSAALHVAAYFGHLEVVKLLLGDSNIDVDIRNSHGETPLHKAALTGRKEVVQLLADRSLSLFAVDDRGKKASDVAEDNDIRALLKDVEDIHRKRQLVSFFSACRNGNLELIRTTLNGPGPPHLQTADVDGNTALHHAAQCDQKEAATLLLQHGADPHRKNAGGRTCIDFVVSEQMQKILEIKPAKKALPECPFMQGPLLKSTRLWNWRKHWVCLNKGTISFYKTKKDADKEQCRRAYKHLDGAQATAGRRWHDFYVRFSDGTTFHLRVLKSADSKQREHWLKLINEHVAYSNFYMGSAEVSDKVATCLPAIEQSFQQTKQKIAALVALSKPASSRLSTSLQRSASTLGQSASPDVVEVNKAADDTYASLQQCLDLVREQDKTRLQQLVEERERCRVLENALEVLATQHEAVLNSVEHLSYKGGSLSSGNSVYFSPPQSVADLEDLGSAEDSTSNPDIPDDDDDFQESSFDEDKTEAVSSAMMGDLVNADILLANPVNGHNTPNGNARAVVRSKFGGRTILPVAQFSRANFSVWSVLKQCIGKDLSKITMPVVFNEPLSFLQRMSEYMEYAHLLDQAAMCQDAIDRAMLVSAFAVSSCASNADRIGKPFNPLLGETFELSRPELGYHMVSEQVSHHPPVSAFDAATDNWHFYGSILPKLKFWGKSIEIQPKGTVTLELKRYKETYTWSNMNCYVNNIIVGKLWIEQYGTMEIMNHTTGLSVVLNFLPSSWSNKELHRVSGYVLDKSKKQVKAVFGKWTQYLRCAEVQEFEQFFKKSSIKAASVDRHRTQSVDREGSRRRANDHSFDAGMEEDVPDSADSDKTAPSDGALESPAASRLLWKIDPRPPYTNQYFGFSLFAMALNELDQETKRQIAPTDTRLRPDVRALENGDLDGASSEKNRLEEKQRAASKRLKRGEEQDWTPTWFSMRKNPVTGLEDWTFNGQYWSRNWTACPDIF
ncbi:hypothetical protein RvY_13992 [Ramazzottius varieornatus]|uniref:Oxysterol-binding protein n=1 Tax=Ramazzottius varieornatus TaxID=947166 RepID=A0A1D1VRW6_RAMVA|nr:hypothetical protein RvY_13992 [Ramazzottius varieornatus]